MACHARLTMTELLAALRQDLGDNNLSTVDGTHRVELVDGGEPPISAPYLALSAPAVQSTYDASLGEYHVIGTLDWWGYVASPAESTEARAFVGLDFASEIVAAIENAHRDSSGSPTLYQLTQLLITVDDVFSDGPDLPPGWAIVHGTIRYETDVQRGI